VLQLVGRDSQPELPTLSSCVFVKGILFNSAKTKPLVHSEDESESHNAIGRDGNDNQPKTFAASELRIAGPRFGRCQIAVKKTVSLAD
jgi:hypothetical protein